MKLKLRKITLIDFAHSSTMLPKVLRSKFGVLIVSGKNSMIDIHLAKNMKLTVYNIPPRKIDKNRHDVCRNTMD